MTAARRLAAILAADVVGYSRLMGQDEAGTAKAVREGHEASTPIVARHDGRIVKTRATACCWNFPRWSRPPNARSRSRSCSPSATQVILAFSASEYQQR